MTRQLTRKGTALSAAPVRIAHLGLGAFARSHQAWFTARAEDGADWGIAGFTGRSPAAARALSAQEGLYTLVERGAREDRFQVIPSLAAAYDGADLVRLAGTLADPEVAIVTLTISEAGYRLDADGRPDRADPHLGADVDVLRRLARLDDARFAQQLGGAAVTTAPGRLLLGLEARRRAGAGPVAIVPCDNLGGTGDTLRRALSELAADVADALASAIANRVSFVNSSVDRITPATTEADRESVERATGWSDAAPVVTEVFADWVMEGAFPAGRPRWERAGAVFVDDVAPFARRKLWLLNGAHTILAAGGPPRGHRTVAEAIDDERLRAAVEAFWADAEAALPPGLGLAGYRSALLERFANARIQHSLEQIAVDATTKMRQRIVPVARRVLATGRPADGAAGAVAVWAHSQDLGEHDLVQVVGSLDRELADDPSFVDAVRTHLADWARART